MNEVKTVMGMNDPIDKFICAWYKLDSRLSRFEKDVAERIHSESGVRHQLAHFVASALHRPTNPMRTFLTRGQGFCSANDQGSD